MLFRSWPKSGKLKPNGILVISILKEIEPGMERKDFLNILQNNIYQELDKII